MSTESLEIVEGLNENAVTISRTTRERKRKESVGEEPRMAKVPSQSEAALPKWREKPVATFLSIKFEPLATALRISCFGHHRSKKEWDGSPRIPPSPRQRTGRHIFNSKTDTSPAKNPPKNRKIEEKRGKTTRKKSSLIFPRAAGPSRTRGYRAPPDPTSGAAGISITSRF